MQRHERYDRTQVLETIVVEHHGHRIMGASEDETVPDDHRKFALQVLIEPFGQLRHRSAGVWNLLHRVHSFDQLLAAAAFGSQMRPNAKTLQLSPECELQLVTGHDFERLELDARATGVE